jgi:acylphosphatase
MARAGFRIFGRVQGVGFRWFVLQQARKLGITRGMARNLGDGSVEVVAEGERAQLDALELDLNRGPRSAHVERVEKFDLPHELELPKSFDTD